MTKDLQPRGEAYVQHDEMENQNRKRGLMAAEGNMACDFSQFPAGVFDLLI
jgi:hypothetical protein